MKQGTLPKPLDFCDEEYDRFLVERAKRSGKQVSITKIQIWLSISFPHARYIFEKYQKEMQENIEQC